jgi:hypothetical protein
MPTQNILPLFRVIVFFANFCQSFTVCIGIAILEEMTVTAVNRLYWASVSNGAPVLFRSGRNFSHKAHEAIEITAIHAVYFFKNIQILE